MIPMCLCLQYLHRLGRLDPLSATAFNSRSLFCPSNKTSTTSQTFLHSQTALYLNRCQSRCSSSHAAGLSLPPSRPPMYVITDDKNLKDSQQSLGSRRKIADKKLQATPLRASGIAQQKRALSIHEYLSADLLRQVCIFING